MTQSDRTASGRAMRPEIPRHLQVLTVPGLHGSGPGHWQSRWEQQFPDWQRIEQHDWSRPSLPLWAERVSEGVMRARRVAARGAVLVAHSFGCLATLRQAALDPVGIAGALLVAPADPDKFGVAALLPTYRLPFPTILAASRNDPWMPQRTAFSWGTLWGQRTGRRGPSRPYQCRFGTRRVARRTRAARYAGAAHRPGRRYRHAKCVRHPLGGWSRGRHDGPLYLKRLRKFIKIRSFYKGGSAESVS
ncbi:putative alpha/beta hydrolase family esterase [Cupriavidus alkaliphilus]|nr:putative alpha/beta hydrolase family esterase [Cupriavidus alkaliphilus]